MREIKFRAWDKNKKILLKIFDSTTQNEWYLPNLKDVELMQYTGVKDKNGVEIYEGDIAFHKDYECFGYVVFSGDELGFAFLVITGSNNKGPTTEFEWLYDYVDGMEVIGNIYENKELLDE